MESRRTHGAKDAWAIHLPAGGRVIKPAPVYRSDALSVWSVFDHPVDYPIGFIARQFLISGGLVRSTLSSVQGSTLEQVRSKLPPGLYRIDRDPGDDPKVVESWL